MLRHCQDGLREKLGKGEIPTEVKDAPFVQIPLGVTEDRLVGTVDIEASMKVSPCSLADDQVGLRLWTTPRNRRHLIYRCQASLETPQGIPHLLFALSRVLGLSVESPCLHL